MGAARIVSSTRATYQQPRPRRFPPPWSDLSLCHPSQHFLITIVIRDLWGQCIRKLMRYVAYGLAILAAVCAIAFTTGNLPRGATASHNNYTAVR